MKAADRAILLVPKKLREPLREPLANWTNALAEAILKKSACWIASLAKLATTKAVEIENKVAASRTRHWKTAIGARAEEGNSRKPTPTRVAYRYLRTPSGWHPSPVGNGTKQASIPDTVD